MHHTRTAHKAVASTPMLSAKTAGAQALGTEQSSTGMHCRTLQRNLCCKAEFPAWDLTLRAVFD